MTRSLIIVRLDRPDEWSGEAGEFYAGMTGHDLLLCTERPSTERPLASGDGIAPTGLGMLQLSGRELASLSLYAHPHYATRCRDYAVYRARAAFPDYDFYWLISSDLRINSQSGWDFFSQFATDTADLLAAKLGPRPAGWGWGQRLRQDGLAVHGATLAVFRLSARAADALLHARQSQSKDPARATQPAWPIDEAFIPTMLATSGFESRDFNAGATRHYTEQSLGGALSTNLRTLRASPSDGLIYHPVRLFDRWITRVENQTSGPAPNRTLENPSAVRSPEGAVALDRLGHSCLRDPAWAEAAFVPLFLAEQLWRIRPWGAASVPPDSGREAACKRSLERAFLASADHPEQATAHPAVCSLGRNNLYGVKPADFDLGPGLPIGQFPRKFALPYAYDFAARELLMTLHASLDEIFGKPFLYAGQRELARVIARVPLASLPLIYGQMDPVTSPVLVFSIGRTGSTLLQKLIGCVTPRSISEPDTLTQLAEAGRAMTALSYDEKRAVIYYAIAPLFHVRLPGGGDGRCVVKLRSQVNGLSQEIARAFPAAKYVFMLRERGAWARSTFRSFGMTPTAAANRLLQAIRALRHLQHNRVDLELIHYEAVVADPLGTTARLTGADPDADPALAARVKAVIAADSQAGHGLSRQKSSLAKSGEESWLEEFDKIWAEIRPASMLRKMQLKDELHI